MNGTQYPLRCQRNLMNSDPQCISDCICYSRSHTINGNFSNCFGAKGTERITRLNNICLHFWHVRGTVNTVIGLITLPASTADIALSTRTTPVSVSTSTSTP